MNERKIKFIKGLDRVFGSPLCALLSLLTGTASRHRSSPLAKSELSGIKKILVIRPGGIGDAILFYPLLHHLKAAFPEAGLHILAEKRNSGVLEANHVAAKVFLYDRFKPPDLLKVMMEGYDLVIDTEQYHNLSAIAAFLTGARYRCGFDTGRRRDLFTHRVLYSQKIYEVYSFLNLFSALTGKETLFERDASFYPVDDRFVRWAKERLKGFDAGRIAVLSPGASIPERRWGGEKFAELAEWLIGTGLSVVLVGGGGDVSDAAIIEGRLPKEKVLNLTGRTSLPQTAGIISLGQIYISSDTGNLHIAYGVGTPTVHLFGPGILEKWAPVGRKYLAITKNLDCSPCTQYGYTPPCPIDAECMKLITVEEVKEAVTRVMNMM